MKTFKISSLFKYIYLGVIISLLYTFYMSNEVYNYNIDGLEVIETATIDLPLIEKRIKSLVIKYKGLSFLISGTSPVTILSDDKIVRNSKVKNISIEENRLILNLENDLVVNIRVDNRGERLTVSSTIPKVFPTIRDISFPYTLDPAYTVEKSDLSYKISGEGDEFHLKLNDLYYIDSIKNRIHLISEEDKISTLTFSPLSSGDLPLAEQWYNTYKPATEQNRNSQKQDYLNKIEEGINNLFNPMVYNQERGQWLNIPSKSKYTEEAAIVYLAQGMKSGNYTERLEKIKALKRIDPQMFAFESTPFLGDIVINGQLGMDQSKKELLEIQTYIKNADNMLYQKWIPEHYFEGEEIDLVGLEQSLESVELASLTLDSLAITLNNLLHILESGNHSSNTNDRIKEITDIIIQKIMWDDSGLYLIENDGLSYMELNLKIAQLLITASQHESSKYSKPIGESLITTYLNNSDSIGSVNITYDIKSKKFSPQKIKSEYSYLLLSDNPYLPHYYQNSGIKIWTVSDSVVVTRSPKEIRITVTYPIDTKTTINSHYLTIAGVEPYNLLYFRSRQWRADRNFEKWGVGYYYSPQSKLLFFMPNHTKTREEILITY